MTCAGTCVTPLAGLQCFEGRLPAGKQSSGLPLRARAAVQGGTGAGHACMYACTLSE